MEVLFLIIGATFLVSLISFAGILFLFLKEKLLEKILLVLVAFSAGALIGGAFLHLLPEAIERVSGDSILKIFFYLIIGFCTIFIFDQFLSWHHHHLCKGCPEVMPFSYSILISDTIHNFIDGLIIAGSFLVSIPLGIASSMAVAFHEIPQEIGDYGVLVYGGFKKVKALFLNFLSATFAIIGGIFGYLISGKIGESIIFLLPFAAGTFIYIASSDLIPEIKRKTELKKSLTNFLVFLLGLGLMMFLKLLGE